MKDQSTARAQLARDRAHEEAAEALAAEQAAEQEGLREALEVARLELEAKDERLAAAAETVAR